MGKNQFPVSTIYHCISSGKVKLEECFKFPLVSKKQSLCLILLKNQTFRIQVNECLEHYTLPNILRFFLFY